MTKPPPKHKPEADWTPAEILEHKRTGREPVTVEWRAYIADVAKAAGVEPSDLGVGDAGAQIEDMTPADHYRALKRT